MGSHLRLGRSFRVNVRNDYVLQFAETSKCMFSFFAWPSPFPDKISAQPTPPSPVSPEYANSSASGNYTYYFRFCNAVLWQGFSDDTAPSRAKKPAYVRHCPANPNFLKTLLLFNTSQCFFVQNLCLCKILSPPFRIISILDARILRSKAQQNFSVP